MPPNRLYREDTGSDAITDLLFNALLGFAFMFFIAFLLINPEQETGKIDTQAEFIITTTWPDDHPDDVDTYVEDPTGGIIWYHVPETGLMHLDRDDRGLYRDTIMIDNKEIANPLNQETISVRGTMAGEYVVNIVHYVANFAEPLPVSVKVEKINPQVTVVYYGVIELSGIGDEKTAIRFSVDEKGEVVSTTRRPKALVELTRKVRRPRSPGFLDVETGTKSP
ncbi:MAG: hypothetical protein HQ511_11780 [Rhodospirillales bacterium]|nr:hypothetical protein [Rhodospirillales bacterium]